MTDTTGNRDNAMAHRGGWIRYARTARGLMLEERLLLEAMAVHVLGDGRVAASYSDIDRWAGLRGGAIHLASRLVDERVLECLGPVGGVKNIGVLPALWWRLRADPPRTTPPFNPEVIHFPILEGGV